MPDRIKLTKDDVMFTSDGIVAVNLTWNNYPYPDVDCKKQSNLLIQQILDDYEKVNRLQEKLIILSNVQKSNWENSGDIDFKLDDEIEEYKKILGDKL